MTPEYKQAPELITSTWLNTRVPLSLAALKGKVVVIYAFQMLCPGCVEHSIPQARKVQTLFGKENVAVIGLHTVFEHHGAMEEVSLKAFLHEYRVDFPVAIDRPSESKNDPLPQTMRKYAMQGTPTLLLIDRNGLLRKQYFGREDDLTLGAEIMALMREPSTNTLTEPTQHGTAQTTADCTDEACPI
ncbi:MAG: redoxin family protein [Kordiimonadaceae bacterium]|nr:redoxin family protein [Kordiimonadaceae bacterium]